MSGPTSGGYPVEPDIVLPCGCVLRSLAVDGVNTLVVVACRAGCLNLADLLAMADAERRTVEIRELPR